MGLIFAHLFCAKVSATRNLGDSKVRWYDIEEDYYNPLYDNMLDLQSDSETEPEDMYYSFRNNNYHGRPHYPYDKDSGFSSGTLM